MNHTSQSKVAKEAYEAHRGAVWGLCYRMTGSAADADELVQDTFARLLEKPPVDTERSLRPWLFRVAVNLSRDRLRKRRDTPYTGPWLPGPIETDSVAVDTEAPEARYAATESVTLAFLRALEELNGRERAVLISRDVYDLSVAETAELLQMTPANVKVTHHRTRLKMTPYDKERSVPDRALQDRTHKALQALLMAMATGDDKTVRKMLAQDVVFMSDGGGEFTAALKPIFGIERVMRFFLAVRPSGPPKMAIRQVNGLPALLLDAPPIKPTAAQRSVLMLELNDNDEVARIYTSLATDKLSGVRLDF